MQIQEKPNIALYPSAAGWQYQIHPTGNQCDPSEAAYPSPEAA